MIARISEIWSTETQCIRLPVYRRELYFFSNIEFGKGVSVQFVSKIKYDEDMNLEMSMIHGRLDERRMAFILPTDNQLHSIPSDKVVISTYPNEYIIPDPDREYLNLPFNAPLEFDRFGANGDIRFKTINRGSWEDFEFVDNHKIAVGFLFTDKRRLNEVRIPSEGIYYGGEEDFLTDASLSQRLGHQSPVRGRYLAQLQFHG